MNFKLKPRPSISLLDLLLWPQLQETKNSFSSLQKKRDHPNYPLPFLQSYSTIYLEFNKILPDCCGHTSSSYNWQPLGADEHNIWDTTTIQISSWQHIILVRFQNTVMVLNPIPSKSTYHQNTSKHAVNNLSIFDKIQRATETEIVGKTITIPRTMEINVFLKINMGMDRT